jgi:hypothetical protein
VGRDRALLFFGSSPSLVFSSKGNHIEIREGNVSRAFTSKDGPFEELKNIVSKYRYVKVKGLPRFCEGSWVFRV